MTPPPGLETLKKVTKVYLIILILFLAYHYQVQYNSEYAQLAAINNSTAAEVSQLAKTKFFRIIRINLQKQCPFWAQIKMCNSGGCNVCRCDEKDIPIQWSKTDEAVQASVNRDLWANQRESDERDNHIGIWHVEDLENDKGEYFDIDLNKEAFTKYNGSVIWQMIYNQNCFSGDFSSMCREEKVMYQLISGLHASVSTHLSYFYKNFTPVLPGFHKPINPADQTYFVNKGEYERRVGNHHQRIESLYFLYKLLLNSLGEISTLLREYPIVSDNIQDDLKAKSLLISILEKIDSSAQSLKLEELSSLNPNYIRSYQKYIHNISRILDCVECEKCRLFGKMQTYGMGTAMKISLGYRHLKRNELVALIGLFNKISISIGVHQQLIDSKSKSSAKTIVYLYVYMGVSLLTFLYIAVYINVFLKEKTKKMFKRAFVKTQ